MEDGVDAVRGRMSGLMAGCPGSGSVDEHRVKRSNPGQNSEDFVDENWGKARSTCNTRNMRIKSNKTLSHQQITKKNWGNFRVRAKNNKIKLENKRRGSEIVINVAHDTKMM